MSEAPSPQPGWVALADALRVGQYARLGFALGAAVAAVVFAFFVLLPGTTRPEALFLGLAVVLGVSVGLLATIVLVAWRAARLTRSL